MTTDAERQAREHFKSMSVDAIKFELDQIDARCRALHQDEDGKLRNKSRIEQSEFDEGLKLRDAAIKLLEEHEVLARVAARGGNSVIGAYGGGGSLVGATSFDTDSRDVMRMSDDQVRDRALRGLESRSKLNPDAQEQVDKFLRAAVSADNPYMDGAHLARRVLLTENPHYRSAWRQLVTDPHPMLTSEETEAVRAFKAYERSENRAMSEGTTTAGGFGVPVFIDPSIILTAQGSGNPFLTLARQVTINTNIWKGISSGGVSWAFQSEGVAVTDNSPALAQPTVQVYMARGFIPYSIEVGQDYPGFADEMATLLASGYDELLLQKFTSGSGTGEPTGLVTQLSANTNVRVALTTGGTVGAPDPYNVWQAVPQRFRRNASWLMSVNANNAIRQLATANVYHAFTETLTAGQIDLLFSKAVFEDPYMSSVTTSTSATSEIAIVGDFSNYVVPRRAGMSVELVPQLFDITNNRPTGQRGWFAYGRIGGGSVNDLGFRMLVNH